MQIKDICLNVIAYILTAILLLYSSWYEYKNGNKTVGILTFIMAIFVIWNAWENYKGMANPSITDNTNTGKKNLLGSMF